MSAKFNQMLANEIYTGRVSRLVLANEGLKKVYRYS
jgi:hypothetical protein